MTKQKPADRPFDSDRSDDDPVDCKGLFERFHDRLTGQTTTAAATAGASGGGAQGETSDPDSHKEGPVADGAGEIAQESPATTGPTGGTGDDSLPRIVQNSDGDQDPSSAPADIGVSSSASRSPAGAASSSENSRSVAAALASELDAGAVDEETRATIREHVGGGPGTTASIRLERLDAKVSKLEAYADEFETLLDELGTAEELATELRSMRESIEELETTALTVDDVDGRSPVTADELEDLRGELAAVETQLDDLEEMKRTLAGAFDAD